MRIQPFSVLNFILILFTVVIETKNRSLEETSALFDGEEAIEQITAAVHTDAILSPTDEKASDSFKEELPKV